MMPVGLRVLCVLLAGWAGAAGAEVRIGVGEIISRPEFETTANWVSGSLQQALATEILKRADEGCDAVAIDTSVQNRRTREREKQLKEQGYLDPSAPDIQPLQVTHLVHGAVGEADGRLDYVIQIVGPNDMLVAQIEGSVAAGDVIAAGQEIAQKAAEQVCRKKEAWQVQASYGDLVINQVVCDVTLPFVLNGTGATAGLVFGFAPGGAGGAWTVGGEAGGVPWSGGGSYTLATGDGTGQLVFSGTWQITTPVGVFKQGGSINASMVSAGPCG